MQMMVVVEALLVHRQLPGLDPLLPALEKQARKNLLSHLVVGVCLYPALVVAGLVLAAVVLRPPKCLLFAGFHPQGVSYSQPQSFLQNTLYFSWFDWSKTSILVYHGYIGILNMFKHIGLAIS
jgi:hypothetical protein